MLWTGLIGSQDTLKVIDDRALIVNEKGDTIFTYGQESHFAIEKMFEEKDLLIKEIINGYETQKSYAMKQLFMDSTINAQKNKIINLELSNRTIKQRLYECENSQGVAETDLEKASKTIKQQSKQIKILKVWNRIKNAIATALLGLALYLTFF